MKKIAAISFYKGVVSLSKALGISHASVSQWGEIIPEKQALRLEKLTDGKLKYDRSLYLDAA